MCDTIVLVQPGHVIFAKNSDRDPNEAQGLEWRPRATYPRDTRVRCTWIEIPQARETHAVLISRPYWMWGAEIGANEHGVAIGNEAVFTHEPYARTGLTGMDLLRLALERAATARDACDVITGLLAEHGQGGGCSLEHRGFTYHNSFIIADPAGAYVLETAGKRWAIEQVQGARSISNGLTIPGFAETHSDRLRTAVAAAHVRRARTGAAAQACLASAAVDQAGDPIAAMFALLREHGNGGAEPEYRLLNGSMGAPCMHGGGLLAAAQTAASWVSDLRPGGVRHWATGTAAPCLSLFKPVCVTDMPAGWLFPGATPDGSLWWRHERLHRIVMRSPDVFADCAAERDLLEREWQAPPPDTDSALARHLEYLERWTETVLHAAPHDRRPWWVRRYWRKREWKGATPA